LLCGASIAACSCTASTSITETESAVTGGAITTGYHERNQRRPFESRPAKPARGVALPTNAAPTVTGITAQTAIVGEQLTDFDAITVADGDDNFLTAVLTDADGGVFNIPGVPNSTVTNNGTSTVTLFGTAANINADLDALTFDSNFTTAITDTFTITVTDPDGRSVTETVTINLSSSQDLTTNDDTLTSSLVNEVFVADAAGELVAADSITDTTSGDGDELRIDDANGVATGAFTSSNIETISVLQNTDGSAVTVDLDNTSGVTALSVNYADDAAAGGDDTTFSNIQSLTGQTMTVSNVVAGNTGNTVTFDLDTAVDLSGASNDISIALSSIAAAITIDVTDATAAAADLESLTLTGSGVTQAVTLGAGTADIETIIASAISDGLSLNLANASAGLTAVTLGAGTDILAVGANVDGGETLDGGASTDDVLTGADEDLADLDYSTVSNFEILTVTDALAESLDITASAFTTVNLTMGQTAGTLTVDSGATVAYTDVGADVIALAVSGTGTSDAVTFQAASAITVGTSIATTGIEALTIDTTSDATFDVDLTDTTGISANSITVTGAGDVNFSATALNGNVTSVDGSASTGAITVTNGANTASISTGSGTDVVTINGANVALAVDAGTGVDTIVLGGASIGAVTITTGADTDADRIDLGSADFASNASIADFTVGTGGDILDLDGRAGSGLGAGDAVATVTTGAIANEVSLISTAYTGNLTAADVATQLDAIGFVDTDAQNTDIAYIAIDNGTDTAIFVFADDAAGTAITAGQLTLLTTLTGISDATTLDAANFDIA